MCSVSKDKSISFYDIHDRKTVKHIQTQKELESVAFCSDGHTIAVGARTGHVMIYDLRKSAKEVSKWVQGHSEPVTALAWQFKWSKEISRTPA